MSVRWECPLKAHRAVLGPEKPRRDNICRYCLPCSQGAGKLVQRVAPALAKARVSRVAKSLIKRAERIERARLRESAYYSIGGVDVREELTRLWRTDSAKDMRAKNKWPLAIPRLDVRRSKRPTVKCGHASRGSNTIRIIASPAMDEHLVRDTLAHELAHILAPPRAGHGVAWKSAYRRICEEAFGFRPRVESRFIHETVTELRRREILQANRTIQAVLEASVPGANEVAKKLEDLSYVPRETRVGP